jgi:uncharacterized membrane protein
MKDKNKIILYYIALLAGVGALITTIFEIIFENSGIRPIISIGLWILYVLVIGITIKDLKKIDKNEQN